jgi:hypothetical protein
VENGVASSSKESVRVGGVKSEGWDDNIIFGLVER